MYRFIYTFEKICVAHQSTSIVDQQKKNRKKQRKQNFINELCQSGTEVFSIQPAETDLFTYLCLLNCQTEYHHERKKNTVYTIQTENPFLFMIRLNDL